MVTDEQYQALLARVDELTRSLQQQIYATGAVSTLGGNTVVQGGLRVTGDVLIEAGEFRSYADMDNRPQPGDGFTGVRMVGGGVEYDATQWGIVGVKNDAMQFGLSAIDGSAIFGGGKVILNKLGQQLITIAEVSAPEATPNPSFINWHDETSGNLVAQLAATNGGSLWFIKTADLSTHQVAFLEDIPASLTAKLGDRRFIYVQASNAAYASSGVAAPVTSGTLSALAGYRSMYVFHQTGALAGNNGGIVSPNFVLTRTVYNPNFKARIRTGSVVTNMRIWVGLFSAAPGNVDNLSSVGNFMAFRFSTVAGDTCWRAVSSPFPGGGQYINTPATELPIVAGMREYELAITYDPFAPGYVFSVDGIKSAVTAYAPDLNANLGFAVLAFTTNAAAKYIGISDVYIEFGI